MIPLAYVQQWSVNAKWQTLAMVEQDLVINKALIDLYNHPEITDRLVFRGGTALNKVYLNPPARYSEDIDFVQKRAEPIGSTIDVIREILSSWLGEPKRKLTERSAKLVYKYESIDGYPAKLKIEINTTEHFQVMPLKHVPFEMDSAWYSGKTELVTYYLEELMGTKLRALYQRRKGRDLFDLWYVFNQNYLDAKKVIEIFQKYCEHNGVTISKKDFLENLEDKKLHKDFRIDMNVLLPSYIGWDFETAFNFVKEDLVCWLD